MIENLEYDAILEKFKKILRDNGLKYTKQREVLIKTLYNSDEHFTPEKLYIAIKEEYPELNVGIATVYRTLNLLEESDMVTSISFGSQGKKFELATKPHHDHLICKKCGLIVEFEDSIIEKRQTAIAKENGFRLTGHMMQLYGVCEQCSKNNIKGK
ncbi:Fur family transcriptional regulator [Campylobacter pinnipediorum]|uniref:Ferric uptake regulation protein n=1 Tax=Campylobacter pinnipediorum subsp. pinnipediorum TaxID=1660067 RepID=A0AAX0L9J4_9BACT|nr:Fur family transcriptional regulator [Campylobacter pinnipediorum]AQW81973.1 ferric uptake regulation protein [Campylobacter pinnipediorum subsp. pinnipediorum]AQW83644.1 ferric uptake regulation protein [Campylobacter pinnipediorum subsp. pinnipediorum]AQW85166.1 ferric uptake regulation protein [Campylobacter pinnipediorum subsp. pinnipediorum]OPA75867.1 transcriptional repressor [Campylobacter pinnipediorum subsp. pinnipediorum]OPA76022.1 transcriptional repressor [Campylobacter pinniped